MPKRPPNALPDITATKKIQVPKMPMDELSMRFGGEGSGGRAGPPNKAQAEITKGYGLTPQSATFPEVTPHKKWFSTKRG